MSVFQWFKRRSTDERVAEAKAVASTFAARTLGAGDCSPEHLAAIARAAWGKTKRSPGQKAFDDMLAAVASEAAGREAHVRVHLATDVCRLTARDDHAVRPDLDAAAQYLETWADQLSTLTRKDAKAIAQGIRHLAARNSIPAVTDAAGHVH